MAEKWLYDEKPIDTGEYIGAYSCPDTGICYTRVVFYLKGANVWSNGEYEVVDCPYAWTHLPNAPKHPDWNKK